MNSTGSDPLPNPHDESPERMLDAFRLHPEWTAEERARQLERLIVSFSGERLQGVLAGRLSDLSGEDGEAALRLLEAYATPELLRSLAGSLLNQPDLPPERFMDATMLLEEAGILADYPDLLELRAEIEDSLDEEASLDELADQLEGSPEGTWLALQGLGVVEPEVRTQIILGLARVPLKKGLIEFLRLLSFAHDPATREAALSAMTRPEYDNAELVAAWESIVADNPHDEVVAAAQAWLSEVSAESESEASHSREMVPASAGARPRTELSTQTARSLVTSVNGQGQATIVISSRHSEGRVTAAFLCDLKRGVRDVFGQIDPDQALADATFEDFAAANELEIIEDSHELALRLLSGSVLLCGAETSPALRYWLEEAIHPGFQAMPFPTPYIGWDPTGLSMEEIGKAAEAVLNACPSWLDTSPLTYEIAEEIDLREGNSIPDPRRDVGAYRYLFEHRLIGQFETYRRMLFWMTLFWQASEADDLGHAALALAVQLSEPQHAVPAHPFAVALTTRSLRAAQANLRGGLDPRRPRNSRG